MSRVHLLRRALQKDGDLASFSPPFPPYSNAVHRDSSPSSGSRISPAVLFIIVILAVLFFISGLLHLLVRFLIKRPSSSAASPSGSRFPELSSSDVLQRQLQQLFHLHDSGLDQAFIDALPVFLYREIVGPKEEPFDCAVCLCEFSEKDKLRLLPVCSHAFHLSCIDTWLLSNSTCPLCRGTLYAPGFPIENPMFDFDDDAPAKTVEIEEAVSTKGVLPVRLGKFRRVSGESGVGETSNSSRLDARRCFSMGSYEYVLGDSVLRVPLKPSQGEEKEKGGENGELEGKKINSVSKGESYSISKIWLWGKKGKFSTSASETHSDLPASLNLDLPWMGRTQGV